MANEGITLPASAQQILVQMQTFQQQYQAVAMQRESLSVQRLEVEKALEELEKLKDSDEVYKAVGPILVKSTRMNLVKEMKERKEVIDVKLKSVNAQEETIRKKLGEAEVKLKGMIDQGKREKRQNVKDGGSAAE